MLNMRKTLVNAIIALYLEIDKPTFILDSFVKLIMYIYMNHYTI